MKKFLIGFGILLVLAAVIRIIDPAAGRPAQPTPLSAEQAAAVTGAHQKRAWIQPTSMEISGAGVVTASYELAEQPLIPLKTLAETRLLLIREALLPFGLSDYRVNLNGPSPGPGLVRRLGAATFLGGGPLNWKAE